MILFNISGEYLKERLWGGLSNLSFCWEVSVEDKTAAQFGKIFFILLEKLFYVYFFFCETCLLFRSPPLLDHGAENYFHIMKNTLVMVGMMDHLGMTITMAMAMAITMTMTIVMLMKKMMTMTMTMATAPACESLAGWHQVFHHPLWGCTLY